MLAYMDLLSPDHFAAAGVQMTRRLTLDDLALMTVNSCSQAGEKGRQRMKDGTAKAVDWCIHGSLGLDCKVAATKSFEAALLACGLDKQLLPDRYRLQHPRVEAFSHDV